MKDHFIYVNSKWIKSKSKIYLSRNLFNNPKKIFSEPICNNLDIINAVESAQIGLQTWKHFKKKEKNLILSKLSNLIFENRIKLAKLESLDTGKSFKQSLSEIVGGYELWKYASNQIIRNNNKKISINNHTSIKIKLEPVGIVALIIPWNFPFIVLSERLPFIFAAGCSVVVKPSEYASQSTKFLFKLIHECEFPQGLANLITGDGNRTGNLLCKNKKVQMISFTGSTSVGKKIMRDSSKNLKKLSLELGGKNPIIILEDADLVKAAKGVITSFTHNSGQACVAGSRLIISKKIYSKFKKILISKLKKIKKLNPITTKKQYEILYQLFVKLKKNNINPIYGKFNKKKNRIMEPLLYENAPINSQLYKKELFGPIIVLDFFDNYDEAIKLANNTQYGLSAMIWSKNIIKAEKIINEVNAGRIWINGTITQNYPFIPIGGFKESGIGRETGEEGIKTYSQIKSIIINK